MPHPIIKDLNTRYATKRYDSTKRIPTAAISVIKQALRLSPSSINSQPWKFILIESDEAKQRLHDSFANMYQFNQPHAKAASHTLLLAYDPYFTKEKYAKRIDAEVSCGHLPANRAEGAMGAYSFAEKQTDAQGFNGHWTKAQVYLALGNLLHALARLGIDSTPMEGVDRDLLSQLFAHELDGHICEVALAMGYHLPDEDYNHGKPKARLAESEVLEVI